MLKKAVVLSIFVALLAAGVGFGQDSPLPIVGSLASDFTFGVFPGAMDRAATVSGVGYGQRFGLDPSSYLFAGLGNIDRVSTIGSDIATITPTFNPIWAGYYAAGEMPWSVFAGFSKEDALYDDGFGYIPEPKSDLQQVYGAPVTVVSGTTSTDYPVLTGETSTEYKTRIFKAISDGAQAIVGFPAFDVGLYLWFAHDNWSAGPSSGNNYGDNNYTQVTTGYYNTALPTEKPVVEADLTYTAVSEEADSVTSIDIAVPFFLPTDTADHYAELIVNLSSTDNSSGSTGTYTVPMDTATWGTVPVLQSAILGTDTSFSQTDTSSSQDFGGLYRITLGGLLGDHPENRFFAGGGLSLTTNSAAFSESDETNDYTVTPGAAAKTQDTKDLDTIDAVYAGSVGFSASATAGHSFFFDFGPAMFGFIPQIDVGFDTYNPDGVTATSWTEVIKRDNDNDGAFTSAADTVVTTERTYTGVSAIFTGSGNVAADLTTMTDINASVAVPIALKVEPGDWPFSFFLGAQPAMSLVFATLKTSTGEFSEKVTDALGDGTVNSTAVTEANTSVDTTAQEVTWDLRVDHNMGVGVRFGEAVTLLVDLAAAVAGGVWDFRSLIVQAVVAMP